MSTECHVVVVTGIPGSGKSTVCRKLELLAKERGINVKVVNYGDVMMEIREQLSIKSIETRDDIRKTNIETQRRLQSLAAKRIADMIKETKGYLIVDTHMSILTEDGYLAGLPSHVLEELRPEIFVLIEASPEEILKRRLKDKSRRRDVERREGGVMEELQFSRFMAAACAVFSGAAVKTVMNPPGAPEKAAEEILNLLLRREHP